MGSGDRWREVSVPFLQPGQVRWQNEGKEKCWFSPCRTNHMAIVSSTEHCSVILCIVHVDVCLCAQVGIVSVALCAPAVEGSYTSHWRLAHAGEQFGPRVWCSIVVDPLAPAPMMADGILVSPCVTPQVEQVY